MFLFAAVVSTELKLTARPGHSSSLAVVAQVNDYKSFELEKCPLARASKFFATCNAPCKADIEPVLLTYPASTATGVSTMETMQAVLAAAWAAYPVKVDLLLRTGCHGANELQILAQSVELFWPRGIGSVVVVLDDSDRPIAHRMVLNNSRHDWVVRFENVSCMPGRIFNQISYLMADHYSTADVIVTIDSDCVLHSPVTPRLLFRDGKIRMPHSARFQRTMWKTNIEFFTGPGTYKFQTMTSQPVTFHRSTLAAYREWYTAAHNGTCYLDGVVRMLHKLGPITKGRYCWMCQLGTFLNMTGITADLYDLVNLDQPTPHPYQRMAVHVPYEPWGGRLDGCAESKNMSLAHKLGSCMDKESLKRMATSEVAMRQGMCLALGASAVPECANMSTKYVRERMFNYASYDYVADEKVKNATVDTFVQEIRQLMRRELMQKGQLQNAPVDSNAVLDEPHHHRSKIGQTPPDFVLQRCARYT